MKNNHAIQDVFEGDEIYWIREINGTITAALVERYYSKAELLDELSEMRRFGPIRRVLANQMVIGEMMKLATNSLADDNSNGPENDLLRALKIVDRWLPKCPSRHDEITICKVVRETIAKCEQPNSTK